MVHYQFENDLSDSTGNGNTGTINVGGSETYVSGIDNQAFDLNGLTHIETSDTPFDFERDDSFSFSTWIKTDVQGVSESIFGKFTSGKGINVFLKSSDDQLRVRISNSNSDKIVVCLLYTSDAADD